MEKSDPPIDPKCGFNPKTRIFRSLAPPISHLPPEDAPLSAAEFILKLSASFSSSWPDSVAFIDSETGFKLTYSSFTKYIGSLAFYLQNVVKLSRNNTAFILSPNSIKVPVVYLSLLSLGIIISTGNPLNTESEISHQLGLSKPVIAFATSSVAGKLPKMKHGMILLDSPEFDSMMVDYYSSSSLEPNGKVKVSQSDVATILYSSGTTGNFKGVMSTHRNLIAAAAGWYSTRQTRGSSSRAVMLYTVPYCHMFGFTEILKSVVLGETVVVMERFVLEKMLRAVEEFRVTDISVAPPVVAAMAMSDLVNHYDLKSLEKVGSAGAPVAKKMMLLFTARFPSVELRQVYGQTEAGAWPVSGLVGLQEKFRQGSVGRLSSSYEAKIVDPDTGDTMTPGKQGELWIRAPTTMKGYTGDSEATLATLTPDGWLKTGDLCYIDNEGYLFIVDRLKELIKYKGYQVPPAELEQLLLSHQEIIDAVVVPYPNEEAGQVPMALVVRQPESSISGREIMDFVAKQVAPYKKIRHVIFVTTIPKTPQGKIRRKNLRKTIIELLPPSRM